MRKVIIIVSVVLFVVGVCIPASYASADKGMKVYKKFMKERTGIDGGKFAVLHSQDEWRELFEADAEAFKSECVESFPDCADFIKSDKFERLKAYLRDFLVKYANDSGNIPKC